MQGGNGVTDREHKGMQLYCFRIEKYVTPKMKALGFL